MLIGAGEVATVAPAQRFRYAWELVNTVAQNGYTFYALRLTSQTWATPDGVDVTVWTRTCDARLAATPPRTKPGAPRTR